MTNIKRVMNAKGLSIDSIARLLGLSRGAASNKVNGKNEFTASEALRLKHDMFPEYDYDYLFEPDESA